jgi:hypothetical protein
MRSDKEILEKRYSDTVEGEFLFLYLSSTLSSLADNVQELY